MALTHRPLTVYSNKFNKRLDMAKEVLERNQKDRQQDTHPPARYERDDPDNKKTTVASQLQSYGGSTTDLHDSVNTTTSPGTPSHKNWHHFFQQKRDKRTKDTSVNMVRSQTTLTETASTQNKSDDGPQGLKLDLRNRSPSPAGVATPRSRSLSARRPAFNSPTGKTPLSLLQPKRRLLDKRSDAQSQNSFNSVPTPQRKTDIGRPPKQPNRAVELPPLIKQYRATSNESSGRSSNSLAHFSAGKSTDKSTERKSPSLQSDTASASPTQATDPSRPGVHKLASGSQGLETLYEKGQQHLYTKNKTKRDRSTGLEVKHSSPYSEQLSGMKMKSSARRGSLNNMTGEGGDDSYKRTVSNSNLTKFSDKTDQMSNGNTPREHQANHTRPVGKLLHNNSEGNLKQITAVRGNALTTQNQQQHPLKTLKHIKSQPVLLRQSKSENKLSALRSRRHSDRQKTVKSDLAEGEESDGEVDRDRIVQWLIGVEEAERPLTPEAVEDEVPQQTDTAIHVVYSGDA